MKFTSYIRRAIALITIIFTLAVNAAEIRKSNFLYVGDVKEGRPHGYGACHYANGSVYYGFWKNGLRDGLGKMEYADGTVDFGNWKHGVYTHPRGMRFRGGDKVYGIDVSRYQKKIDWEKLSLGANSLGNCTSTYEGSSFMQPVLFALVKSTQGTTIVDQNFRYNFTEAKRCGIIRGAYHFMSVFSSVEEQVKAFIANTPLEPGDLPPVLDLEIAKGTMERYHDKVVRMAKQWLELIERHYGVKPIIYTYNNYYRDYLQGHGLDDYDYWIARYGTEPSARHWEIWQFTQEGRCRGITEHYVDLNLFRGNYADLREYVAKKGIKKIAPAEVDITYSEKLEEALPMNKYTKGKKVSSRKKSSSRKNSSVKKSSKKKKPTPKKSSSRKKKSTGKNTRKSRAK